MAIIILYSSSCISDDKAKNQSDLIQRKKYFNDTSYRESIKPLICNFDGDEILDTISVVTHKKDNKKAILIKYGDGKSFRLLRSGKELEQNFKDFDWIFAVSIVKKGEKIWNNVIDGEIVGEDQVPENKKILFNIIAVKTQSSV